LGEQALEEVLDEQEQSLNLAEYWNVVRRRHWYLLAPLFCVWLLVWLSTWFIPSVYRSGTLILVEQPAVPQQFVPSNIQDDLQSRLDSITQQILSRTRLLHIIEQLDLYPNLRVKKSQDEVVDQMRRDIEIELVRSSDRDRLSAFNVYYRSDNPRLAQEVTNELTNLFISENLEARQQQSENTTKFLENQLEEARQKLASQEQRVRQFKDEHLGELPTQTQANLQILGGLQAQLQAQEDALNRARQQNTYLESMLGQYKSLQKSAKTSDGTSLGGLPAIDRELERLRTQLTDLSSRYTEKHPDIRKLKGQIARLERARQQIVDNPSLEQDIHATSSGDIKEMAPQLELESQLKANQIEIKNHQTEINQILGRISDYQARLNRAPVREQQLTDITRDYEQSRADYDSLLAKKNQSQLATNLERTQQGEHFRVVDPPNLPVKPYLPNRLKLSMMGLFAGLALGAVFTVGAELTDDRVYSERMLKKLGGVEVIAEIPALNSQEEEREIRRSMLVAIITTGIVFFIIAVGSAITYLRG
jgi:polysaccharide chain length determinant protein (PEP-CTERM system associated)